MTSTERLYDMLAETLDHVGQDKAPLFLAKVALALGHALNDPDRAVEIIEICAQDLE